MNHHIRLLREVTPPAGAFHWRQFLLVVERLACMYCRKIHDSEVEYATGKQLREQRFGTCCYLVLQQELISSIRKLLWSVLRLTLHSISLDATCVQSLFENFASTCVSVCVLRIFYIHTFVRMYVCVTCICVCVPCGYMCAHVCSWNLNTSVMYLCMYACLFACV
jgi:hypothetical protein